MTLAFRSRLATPIFLERPIQSIHPSLEIAEEWAKMALRSHVQRPAGGWPEGTFVEILETVETVVKTVTPERPATPVQGETLINQHLQKGIVTTGT